MSEVSVHIVVAMAADRTIGHKGRLPWHLPEDLKRFRALTIGRAVIMGRRTHESIGKALPHRLNVVLSRQSGYDAGQEAIVCHSWEEALEVCRQRGHANVFVIGGAEVYASALPVAEAMHITHVDDKSGVGGDARFPQYDESAWRLVSSERGDRATYNQYQRIPRA